MLVKSKAWAHADVFGVVCDSLLVTLQLARYYINPVQSLKIHDIMSRDIYSQISTPYLATCPPASPQKGLQAAFQCAPEVCLDFFLAFAPV
mmetsp:Transcript_6913/g.9536  ORF Transcript_6913/g.9536 Transcript_6913/m.9536 type:complete len:91 (-) Transcript_6913:208-480(-)